ncbi:MAG TPA: gliding motility-associated C-terminal domain-containing protein [Puia sp.]
MLTTIVHAQTCTTGLGDPIVNITFGAGPNFGPPLGAGITNMQYVANQCPFDGTYTIASSTNNCYPGDWLNVNADHTGDPTGYFMLINASVQPSDFYVQTVTGLCGSTSYQFAAWILNMASHMGEILPNITFNIERTDGTVLQSLRTGDIPVTNPAKWNQYAFYFTTPPGISSVVLRMTNNAPGGYGNDLAVDDITFRTAGPSVNVTISGHTSDTVTICPGPANNLQFLATVKSCYPSTSYQWQESTDNGSIWTNIPGAVNPSYSAFPTTTGNYLYRLTAAQTGNIGIASCQVASTPDTIVILKASHPAVIIGTDSNHVCAGSPASFTAVPSDGGPAPLYQWLLNGVPVGTSDPAYSSNTLKNGDQVSCSITSNATCPANPTALSNIIAMSVVPDVVSSLNVIATATVICSDSLVIFTALPFNGGSHPSYQWMVNGRPVGADTSLFSSRNLNNGDRISAVMTGNLLCSSPVNSSDVVTMMVYQTPVITLTPDTVIAAHSSIRLDPSITGQVLSFQWSPATGLDNPDVLDPVASPAGNTTYELRVSSSAGCTASAKETVNVFYDLLMPNAFTPNGDGRNDLFRIPPSVPVSIKRFSVYDRWGALVFTTTSSSAGWDGQFSGKPQPSGTYVWMIEFYNPLIRKLIKRNGTVELIR